MSVKTRLAELNARFAEKLTAKGVEASADETYTALVNKMDDIPQGETVDGAVIPKEYFGNFDTSGSCKHYPTITSENLDGVVTIRDNAFGGWYLESIEMPSSVQRIGTASFSGCTVRQPLVIPDTVTFIGVQVFQGSKIEHITVGKGITNLSAESFFNCGCITLACKGDLISASSNCFGSSTKLANFSVEGKIYCAVSFASCPLTLESAQNIIDALVDNTGNDAMTIAFSATTKALLTEEMIAQATNKNWTIA